VNLPDHSEDVAGVDEPAVDRISLVRTRVHWKAVALNAEREAQEMRGLLTMYRVGFWICAGVWIVTLMVAVK
jgi:hypothetical protein